ncbi:MAG: GNAT family N-acetyltransferase [Armatimonadaceae bacterium]
MTAILETSRAVQIRPFTPDDYSAVVAIHNLQYPDYTDTVEQWRFRDERRDEKVKWSRFVATDDQNQIVGMATYNQSVDMYHPRKFSVDVFVHPEFVGQGIGKALYEKLLEALIPFDPILVRANAREDYTRSVRFLTDRGFTEEMREWESRLNPQAWDPAAWQDVRKKVLAQGIVVKSVAELQETDPEWRQKLFEMDWSVTLDMPAPDTLTKPTFEHFVKHVLENPDFLPEAWYIALDGENYVGESALWRSSTDNSLYVGATGVLREYRRRGIATALKIYALEYARAAGCPLMKTWNAQINRAMLSINEALGFEKQPAWISYVKVLRPEENAE